VSNPTVQALEARLAAFEGGAAALAVASGQAASAYAVLDLAQAGDNFVTSTGLYGGTWILFDNTLREFGIEARFVDPSDPENFRRATDSRTRLYYAETLPNPKLEVFPIQEVAEIGRSLGVPLVMDNTSAPLIVRPLQHGAAIVMYSTTKYIGGHGTTLGGAIIDGGNFPWEQHADRFPQLSEPDEAYPDVIWNEVAKPLGPIAFILRARMKLLADFGAAMTPLAAFHILQGLETLPIRMEQHNANAVAVAEYLKDHPKVATMYFPGLQIGEHRRRADAYMRNGYGALIGFELKGGIEAGREFIEALKLFYHVANIGDARSLAIQPAATTHSQLSEEDQLAAGVTPGFVRLSIGIEHKDDIIADLAQALGSL
jgi:O-acetylhomoserine (thiol)-lyase